MTPETFTIIRWSAWWLLSLYIAFSAGEVKALLWYKKQQTQFINNILGKVRDILSDSTVDETIDRIMNKKLGDE